MNLSDPSTLFLLAIAVLAVLVIVLYFVIAEASRSKQILAELGKIKRLARLDLEARGVDKDRIENELNAK